MYVNLMKFWYCNQLVKVRYAGSFSSEWQDCNGIRQGGALSGLLFNVYIDSLLTAISDLNIGCKIGHTMSNIIAYADGIVIMLLSAVALQLLIDMCFNEAPVLNLNFNTNKSKCMILNFAQILILIFSHFY